MITTIKINWCFTKIDVKDNNVEQAINILNESFKEVLK